MAKRRKSRSRKKGVRYIANALKKYFKGKYPNYRSALPRAREIHAELKTRKQKVILANIFPYERRKRGLKKAHIELTPELSTATNYFYLSDYPMWIARLSNKIWFTSELSPAGVEPIQGGDIPSYQEYFAAYVSYVNAMKAQTDPLENRYETEWMVVCTPLVKKSDGTYWSKIISCDEDGDPFDYGFDPKRPGEVPEEPVLKNPEPVVPGVPAEPKTGAEPISTAGKSQRDVEFERQKSMQGLMELYKDGLITKMEFKEYMGKIK